MNFENVNSTTDPKANDGERIVSASLLRGGRIIFTTLIPIPPIVTTDPSALCTSGSKSASWLMELDALSGSRLLTPALDITRVSGTVDELDVVTVTVNGETMTVPASGLRAPNGSSDTPAVITNPGAPEMKCLGSSEAKDPYCIKEKAASSGDAGAGRQSWRQL